MDYNGPLPFLTDSDRLADVPEYSEILAHALRTHIQRVRVGIPLSSSSNAYQTVTFSPQFDTTPNVVAVAETSTYSAAVVSITRSSANIYVRHLNDDTATRTVYVQVIATDI